MQMRVLCPHVSREVSETQLAHQNGGSVLFLQIQMRVLSFFGYDILVYIFTRPFVSLVRIRADLYFPSHLLLS